MFERVARPFHRHKRLTLTSNEPNYPPPSCPYSGEVAKQATTPRTKQLLGLENLPLARATIRLSHGCGTQDQNFADRQHPGVCGHHLVLGVLPDPGPLRGAHPAGPHYRPEDPCPQWKSFQLGGQTVHSPEAGEAGGRGLQPAER